MQGKQLTHHARVCCVVCVCHVCCVVCGLWKASLRVTSLTKSEFHDSLTTLDLTDTVTVFQSLLMQTALINHPSCLLFLSLDYKEMLNTESKQHRALNSSPLVQSHWNNYLLTSRESDRSKDLSQIKTLKIQDPKKCVIQMTHVNRSNYKYMKSVHISSYVIQLKTKQMQSSVRIQINSSELEQGATLQRNKTILLSTFLRFPQIVSVNNIGERGNSIDYQC